MPSFALIGAAGYVAPRHMKAMQVVGGDLKVVIASSFLKAILLAPHEVSPFGGLLVSAVHGKGA